MKTRLIRAIAGVSTVLLLGVGLPVTAHAQDIPPAGSAVELTAGAPSAPAISAQLDQLLAPIALYPDELLSQILMAATYPLEVVEAARWVKDPANAGLKGDQLAAALQQQDWDPSVKSLVPFPQILQMMNDRIDWMQKLGDAFLAQQADVMDSVQRLRRAAQVAGSLQSVPQQTVTMEGQDILVQPTNPEMVYVPQYNPQAAYGAWPYPDYPPDYFFPPDYFGESAFAAGMFFGVGIAVVDSLWGWDYWDWGHHRVHINPDRFNRINGRHQRITRDTWEHDPYHRHGVPYRDLRSRERFVRTEGGPPEARRDFRGFSGVRTVPQQASRPFAGERVVPQPQRRQREQASRLVAPTPPIMQPAPVGIRLAPRPQREAPPAFFRSGSGRDAVTHSERGRESRHMTAPSVPRAAPPPSSAPRSAPVGGGARRGDRR